MKSIILTTLLALTACAQTKLTTPVEVLPLANASAGGQLLIDDTTRAKPLIIGPTFINAGSTGAPLQIIGSALTDGRIVLTPGPPTGANWIELDGNTIPTSTGTFNFGTPAVRFLGFYGELADIQSTSTSALVNVINGNGPGINVTISSVATSYVAGSFQSESTTAPTLDAYNVVSGGTALFVQAGNPVVISPVGAAVIETQSTSFPALSVYSDSSSSAATVTISNSGGGPGLNVVGDSTINGVLTVAGNILPSTTLTDNLGSSGVRWNEVFGGEVDLVGSASGVALNILVSSASTTMQIENTYTTSPPIMLNLIDGFGDGVQFSPNNTSNQFQMTTAAGAINRQSGGDVSISVGTGVTSFVSIGDGTKSVEMVINSGAFSGMLINGTPGATCSGTPTSSFASVGGIVTHC